MKENHSNVAPKPPKEGSQTQNGFFFSVKLHFAWIKFATKFLCVNTVNKTKLQSCKAFSGLSIRTKMIGGGRPFKGKLLFKVNHPLARERIPAMQISNEVPRISDFHRSDYDAI